MRQKVHTHIKQRSKINSVSAIFAVADGTRKLEFLQALSKFKTINPLNAELNTICHLLALLGAHHILHINRMRVKTPYCTKFICLH
jgi:maleate cis-trans isomerase